MNSDDLKVLVNSGVANDKTGADLLTWIDVVSVTGGLIPSSISNVIVCIPLLSLA